MTVSDQRINIQTGSLCNNEMQPSQNFFKNEIKKVIACLRNVGMNFAVSETNSVVELKYFLSVLTRFRLEFFSYRSRSSRSSMSSFRQAPPAYSSLYPYQNEEGYSSRSKYHRGSSFTIPEGEQITVIDGSDSVFMSSPDQKGKWLMNEEALIAHVENSERARSGSELKSFNFHATRHSTTSSRASMTRSLSSGSCRRQRTITESSIGSDNSQPEYIAIRGIDEVDAKSALCRHVSKKIMSPKKPAKKLSVHNINTEVIWHYRLATIHEQRHLTEGEEPYTNQVASSKYNENPDAWNVHVDTHNAKTVLRVPNTTKICTCPQCGGKQTQGCSACGTKGTHQCWSCNGDGRTMVHDTQRDFSSPTKSIGGMTRHETCHHCGGSGNDRCGHCSGSGQISCSRCRHSGKIATFITLTIEKKRVCHDHYTDETVPRNILKKSSGTIIFEETDSRVKPLISEDCCNSEMISASHKFTRLHKTKHRGRITSQTQVVSILPFHHIKATIKEKHGDYWIVGNERNVYNPNYPKRFLQGACAIM